MKKFKVGERYKVTDGIEKGNIIEITKIKVNKVFYKTIKGEAPYRQDFCIDSIFARNLEPTNSNETVFKVGDRVRVVRTVPGARDAVVGDIGIIKYINDELPFKYAIEFEHERSDHYHYASGHCKEDRGYWCSYEMLEKVKVKNECIVIYRKDNQMIALDKSTGEKAVAKCSPEDIFDYKVGAKLAFSRLMGEEEDKASGGNFKVLCVEDIYLCGDLGFKKGKVYEYVNGSCLREDNHKSGNYKNFAELIKYNIDYKGKLFEVKEIKRKANVGEYVKIVNASNVPVTCGKPEYKNGDIVKIIDEHLLTEYVRYGDGVADDGKSRILKNDEYVVLEGDYQKEVEKPRYNGKIIFIEGDDVFKTGHVYEVKDGKLKWPGEETFIPYGRPFENLDDIKDYFTESGSGLRKRKKGWSSKTLKLMEVKE